MHTSQLNLKATTSTLSMILMLCISSAFLSIIKLDYWPFESPTVCSKIQVFRIVLVPVEPLEPFGSILYEPGFRAPR